MVSQIDPVPEDTVVNLETISEKLKGAVNFNIWNQRIDRELQMDDLQNLIDSSIPRPSPENPRYDIWRKASKRVGNWLTKQLDNNMFESWDSPLPLLFTLTKHTMPSKDWLLAVDLKILQIVICSQRP